MEGLTKRFIGEVDSESAIEKDERVSNGIKDRPNVMRHSRESNRLRFKADWSRTSH